MMQTEQTENTMGTAKIPGLVLKTGIPLMVSLLINSLYNFVDSVFVSRISEDAGLRDSLSAYLYAGFFGDDGTMRNVSLIWMAFVLAEAVVIPFGMILWKKESWKALYQQDEEAKQYIPLG